MSTGTIEDLRGALVVAVDDSAPALEALRYAADLARRLGEPLGVVSVWNFVNSPRPPGSGDELPLEADWQAAAEQRLAALLDEHGGEGVDLRPVVVHGNTAPVLLAVSQVARHLFLGSRGRGGFAGLLLGSTSDQLVHHASCPVTVVRRAPTAGAVAGA